MALAGAGAAGKAREALLRHGRAPRALSADLRDIVERTLA